MSTVAESRRFEGVYGALLYGVAAIGFLSILLVGDSGPLEVVAMGVALSSILPSVRRRGPSDTTWRLLTLLYMLFSLVQYMVLAQPGLRVAREMVIYLQLNRLFQRKHNRDDVQVLTLAFLQVLVGCVLTIHPLFALVLVAFLVCGSWTLTLLQLKSGMDIAPPVPTQMRGSLFQALHGDRERWQDEEVPVERRYGQAVPLLRWPFLAVSGAVTMVMLVATVAMFLVTPRMEISLFRDQASTTTHVAGFSEQVRLGEVGQIRGGTGRVMRVQVDLAEGMELGTPYWYGLALDEFDGVNWSLSRVHQELYRPRPLNLGGARLPRGTNVVQRYTVESLDSKVVFGMPRVLGIDIDQNLLKTLTGSYQLTDKRGRAEYVVYSRVEDPSPKELMDTETRMPPRLAQIYLQLPELSPRVQALALQITAGKETGFEKAMAIQEYLRSRYTYTDNPQMSGPSPVEDFLFNVQAGHCEYFATAMVVLARSAGQPARLVNGFMGGSFNPVGNYWVVRQGDAHSWAELWYNGVGWVRFDATPAAVAAAAGAQSAPWYARVRDVADYLELQWYHYILDYDLRSQVEFISGLINPSQALTMRERIEEERQATEGARRIQPVMMLLSLALLAYAGSMWVRQRREQLASEPVVLQTQSGRRFLKQRLSLHRQLDRLGLDRQPSETPLERARRSDQQLGLQTAIQGVETRYYAARYGDVDISHADLERVEQLTRRLRQLPRPRKSTPRRPSSAAP